MSSLQEVVVGSAEPVFLLGVGSSLLEVKRQSVALLQSPLSLGNIINYLHVNVDHKGTSGKLNN